MSGYWQFKDTYEGFIDLDYVYYDDRDIVRDLFTQIDDRINKEFRIKLIGSIRNIQKQKEQEELQEKKNSTYAVTGFLSYAVGMSKINEAREMSNNGDMVYLFIDKLREANEENGIVLSDMILEQIGQIVSSQY